MTTTQKEQPMNLIVPIPHSAISQMEPILDDAEGAHRSNDTEDEFLVAMVEVLDAINAGKPRKSGHLMVTLKSRKAVETLMKEAEFRSYHCFEQSQQAFEKEERMYFLAIKKSFDAIVKKCNAALVEAASQEVK